MNDVQRKIITALKASPVFQDAMALATLEPMEFGAEPAHVSVFDGPVVGVSAAPLDNLRLSLYCDEGDNIEALSAALCRAAEGIDLPFDILFRQARPIFDEADFQIGTRLDFGTRLPEAATRQAAA